jgi:hypothetical protein
MHAMHQMAGENGGSEHGKSKPAAHPVACSACFAIEAARLDPDAPRARHFKPASDGRAAAEPASRCPRSIPLPGPERRLPEQPGALRPVLNRFQNWKRQ